MYKTGCIKDGGKRKILKGFPKETITLRSDSGNTTETLTGMPGYPSYLIY
jgi:hypothetical protein